MPIPRFPIAFAPARSVRPPWMLPAVAAALLGAAPLCPPAALAQPGVMTLDENGEWQTTSRPVEGTAAWSVDRAREELADDRPAAAYARIDNWIKAHDRTGKEADLTLGAPDEGSREFFAEALLVRGDAQTAMGDEYNALYDYERIIKEYPGTDTFVTAVERELDIGVRYVGGMKRRFMGVRILDATDVGEELLIRVQERLPGSRLAERAGIELADYYYDNHDLDLASEAYQLFLENYRNSQYAMKAMQRRVYATIAQYKGPKYDGSKLLDAQILVKRFSGLYPEQARRAGLDDALLVRLDESAAMSMLESARWYTGQGDEPSARYVLQRLVAAHPQTAAAREAVKSLESHHWKLVPPSRPAPEPPPPAAASEPAGSAGPGGAGAPAEGASP